jgi:ABC-type dipeptide/oligopeptide/nickel transport system permease component
MASEGSPMTRYIVRRLIGTIPTLFVVSLLIYSILLAAPGGPQQRFAQNPRMTATQIENFKKRWGLDQPIPKHIRKISLSVMYLDSNFLTPIN